MTALPWNLYDKVIKEKTDFMSHRGFSIEGGEVDDGDTTLFDLLLVDEDNQDRYRFSFNSSWCPEKNKDWLLGVMANEYVRAIREAKFNSREKMKHAITNVLDLVGLANGY